MTSREEVVKVVKKALSKHAKDNPHRVDLPKYIDGVNIEILTEEVVKEIDKSFYIRTIKQRV